MVRAGTLVWIGILTSIASGQVIDGTRDAVYGPAKALQDTPTGFGDNLSELNAAYGIAHPNGNLSLMFTGNLENGGNGLVLFIDSKPGGAIQSVLGNGAGVIGSVGGRRTDDWGTDTDGGPGINPTPGGGSILDPGFNPDFSIEINVFDQQPGDEFIEYYINIIDMTLPNEPNDNRDIYLGQNFLNQPAVTQTYFRDQGATNAGVITHAFNNTNTAGVLQFDFGNPPGPLGDPTSATTGFEIRLSTEFLGGGVPRNIGLPVRILPFITNPDGDFVSNQFLPGLGGVTNLGGPGGDGGIPLFDSTLFPGNNYLEFRVVTGDFNADGNFNCLDVDSLVQVISQNTNNPSFDLTGDGLVNLADLTSWLSAAGAVNLGPGLSYRTGDATLDGYVDGRDFGNWNQHKGTATPAWCSGDFNADGLVNNADFALWFANRFTSSFSLAVPEPGVALTWGGLLLWLALLRIRGDCLSHERPSRVPVPRRCR